MRKPLSEWTPEQRLRWGGWEDLKRREDLRTIEDLKTLTAFHERADARYAAAGLTHGEAMALILEAREEERRRWGKSQIAESVMKLTEERLRHMEEERGEPVACHCCGYPAQEFGEYRGPVTHDHPGGRGMSVFCEICASTFLSHAITYPLLYGDQHYLFGAIGWIANHLQSEIRKLRK